MHPVSLAPRPAKVRASLLHTMWVLLVILGALFTTLPEAAGTVVGVILLTMAATVAWRAFRQARPAGHLTVAGGQLTLRVGRREHVVPLACIGDVIVDPEGVDAGGERLYFPDSRMAGEQTFLFARHAGTALMNPQRTKSPNLALKLWLPAHGIKQEGIVLEVDDPHAAASLFQGHARIRNAGSAERSSPIAPREVFVPGLGRVVRSTRDRLLLTGAVALAFVAYAAGKMMVRTGHAEGRWIALLAAGAIGLYLYRRFGRRC